MNMEISVPELMQSRWPLSVLSWCLLLCSIAPLVAVQAAVVDQCTAIAEAPHPVHAGCSIAPSEERNRLFECFFAESAEEEDLEERLLTAHKKRFFSGSAAFYQAETGFCVPSAYRASSNVVHALEAVCSAPRYLRFGVFRL